VGNRFGSVMFDMDSGEVRRKEHNQGGSETQTSFVVLHEASAVAMVLIEVGIVSR
jgi:hypothetical protein